MNQDFSTTFSISDQMSAPLAGIIKELESLEKMTESLQKDFDGLDDNNFKDLNSGIGSVIGEIKELDKTTTGAQSSINKVSGKAFMDVAGDVKSLTQNLGVLEKDAGSVKKSLDNITTSAFDSVNNDAGKLNKTLNSVDSSASRARAGLEKADGVSFSGLRSEANKTSSKIEGIGESAKKAEGIVGKLKKVDVKPEGLDDLQSQLSGLGDAINLNNFLNLSEIVGEVVGKLGEMKDAAIEAGATLQGINTQINVGLGTEVDTNALKNTVLDIYGDAYGESVEDVTGKVVYAKQVFGDLLKESDMRPLMEQFITLDDAGSDFNETIRAAYNIMQHFQGEDLGHINDVLAAANQRGLNLTDELTDNLAEYAGRWGEAGVSFEKYMSIYETGIKSGAYNADKVGDFLNEFMTSLDDGRIEEALGSLGQNTQDIYKAYTEDLATPDQVLDAVLGDINNLGSSSAMKNATSTIWSSLGEDNSLKMIESLKDVPNLYSNVEGAAQRMADSNSTAVETISRMWETFRLKTLGAVGEALSNTALDIIEGFQSIGSTVSGLWNGTITFPDLTQQGLDTINGFVNGFIAGLPQMMTEGWNAVTGFITGLQQKAPELLLGALDMIITLAQGIGDNLPALGQKAGETMMAFAQGLKDNLPTIISTGIEAAGNFIAGLWQRLPEILSAGMSLISGLLKGIVNMLPGLIQTGANIIMAFLTTIWQALPSMIHAGLEIVTSMITGLVKGIPTLIFKVFEMIIQVAQAIVNGIPQVVHAAFQFAGDFLTGLVQGLADSWNVVADWFNEHFGWIINWVKDLFGIHSPSTVFSDFGSNVVAGFKGGLENAWGAVTSWFSSAWEGIKSTAQSWGKKIAGFFGFGGDEEGAQQFDYTETINKVNTQLEQLKANVAAAFTAIETRAYQSNSTVAQNTMGAYAGLGEQIVGQTAVFVARVNQMFLAVDMSVIGLKLISQLALVFGDLQTRAVKETGVLVASISNALLPLISSFKETFNDVIATSTDALENLYLQSMSLLSNVASGAAARMTVMQAEVTAIFIAMTDSAIAEVNRLSAASIARIASMGVTIITSITAFKTAFITIWTALKDSTLAILDEFKNSAIQKIKELVQAVRTEIGKMPGIFNSVATESMDSFARGISDNMKKVTDKTNELVQAVKDAFIKGLGIHSPSDETYWFGLMTGLGFIEGLSDSQLAEFAKNTLNNIIDAFLEGKFSADDLVDFLGEDSLKVIHAIQDDPELAAKAMIPGTGGGGRVIDVARSYVGYRSDDWEWSIFNSRVGMGAGAWCAMFVKAVCDEAGVDFPAIFGVPSLMRWAQSNGRWSSVGEPGDAIVLNDGYHIGLFVGYNPDGSVQVIDGNTIAEGGGGRVGVYEHARNDAVGFIKIPGANAGGSSASSATQQIAYPLIGTRGDITSYFGNRPYPGAGGSTNHGGIDIAAPTGTPIASALAGNVTQAGWNDGYGLSVTVNSGALDVIYGHMSSVIAQAGQAVGKGQQIGLVGSTGNSTGPHLHFEMRQGGNRIDPLPYLEGGTVAAVGGYGMNLIDQIQNAYNRKYGIATTAAYNPSAGVEQWRGTVQQALTMLGQPLSLTDDILYAINRESSGNPNAINLDDSNAMAGHPSQGLLQTIPSTFAAYRNPSLPDDITNPLANIYAALNYMIQVYGSVANVVNPRRASAEGWYGYAVGTRYVPQDMLAMIHKGEAILPAGQNPYASSGGDYLYDIASRMIEAGPSPAAAYYGPPGDTGARVISVGDINTTVNVEGSNADPQQIAETVSKQIWDDFRLAVSTKSGV